MSSCPLGPLELWQVEQPGVQVQWGVNLKQAVAKFHTEGVAPSWLESAAAQVVVAADRQDQLVFELGQLDG